MHNGKNVSTHVANQMEWELIINALIRFGFGMYSVGTLRELEPRDSTRFHQMVQKFPVGSFQPK